MLENEFIDMKEACGGVNVRRESIGLSAGSAGGREEMNKRSKYPAILTKRR